MKKTLLTLEVIGICVALVCGVLWILNPQGTLEPITFMALLVGTTVVDVIRRNFQKDDTRAELNKLQSSVEEILREIRTVENRSKSNTETAEAVTEEPTGTMPDKNLDNTISNMLSIRRNIADRLEKIAELRGIEIDVSNPEETTDRIKFPISIEEAICEILNFTNNLVSKDATEIITGKWVFSLSDGLIPFLDRIIEYDLENV